MSNHNQVQQFIQEDLFKSGLTPKDFKVEPLLSEEQLWSRLGFASIDGTRIMDVGGYWIPFPNVPNYYRLKLRREIKDENGHHIKYLSPGKAKGKGNHVYLPLGVERLLKEYTPGLVIGLVEGEKKAQAATNAGIPTIGVSGAWNLNDKENDFLPELEQYNWKNKVLKIAFDSDMTSKPDVKHAELRAAVKFTNRGAEIFSVRLPNEPNGDKNGADDFIKRYGAIKYQELNQKALPTFGLLIQEDMKVDTFIKEIARLDSNIELGRLINLLHSHTKVPTKVIRAEIKKQIASSTAENPQDETYSEQEILEAEQILKSPDILSKMTELTAEAGYVGEEANQKTLYLSYTSRKQDRAISAIIKGGSASGKSTLAHIIQRLMPKKDVRSYSMLTPKALVHSKFDLSHSILSIEERHGSEAADYSVRTVISEQEISILMPVKNEKTGDYTAVEKRIPAIGLSYCETTTREQVHAENQTRVLDLFMDESPEMNKRVIKQMAQAAANPKDTRALEKEFRVWRCAQSLLKVYKVRIPFAEKLDSEFPANKTRVRRDFLRFLALIEAHALLYQYQRQTDENGYLLATLDDIKAVIPLAEKVLSRSLKEISPNKEFVLSLIQGAFEPGQWFAIGELIECINVYQCIKGGVYIQKLMKTRPYTTK